jgi:hypothetical protein
MRWRLFEMTVYSELTRYSASIFFDFSAAGTKYQNTGKTVSVADGDPVAVLVGTGYGSSTADAVRSTADANRPVYRANFSASGYPALQFDGTDDLMLMSATGAPSGTSSLRFLLAAVHATSTSGARTIFSRASDIPSQVYLSSANLECQNPTFTATNASATGRFVLGLLIDGSATKPTSMVTTGCGGAARKISATSGGSGSFSFGGYVSGVNLFAGGISQVIYGTMPSTATLLEFHQIANALSQDWGMGDVPLSIGSNSHNTQ